MDKNNVGVQTETDDPAIDSFLKFLAHDIDRRPEAFTTLSPALAARIVVLTEAMEIDPNAKVDGEVDLQAIRSVNWLQIFAQDN